MAEKFKVLVQKPREQTQNEIQLAPVLRTGEKTGSQPFEAPSLLTLKPRADSFLKISCIQSYPGYDFIKGEVTITPDSFETPAGVMGNTKTFAIGERTEIAGMGELVALGPAPVLRNDVLFQIEELEITAIRPKDGPPGGPGGWPDTEKVVVKGKFAVIYSADPQKIVFETFGIPAQDPSVRTGEVMLQLSPIDPAIDAKSNYLYSRSYDKDGQPLVDEKGRPVYVQALFNNRLFVDLKNEKGEQFAFINVYYNGKLEYMEKISPGFSGHNPELNTPYACGFTFFCQKRGNDYAIGSGAYHSSRFEREHALVPGTDGVMSGRGTTLTWGDTIALKVAESPVEFGWKLTDNTTVADLGVKPLKQPLSTTPSLINAQDGFTLSSEISLSEKTVAHIYGLQGNSIGIQFKRDSDKQYYISFGKPEELAAGAYVLLMQDGPKLYSTTLWLE